MDPAELDDAISRAIWRCLNNRSRGRSALENTGRVGELPETVTEENLIEAGFLPIPSRCPKSGEFEFEHRLRGVPVVVYRYKDSRSWSIGGHNAAAAYLVHAQLGLLK